MRPPRLPAPVGSGIARPYPCFTLRLPCAGYHHLTVKELAGRSDANVGFRCRCGAAAAWTVDAALIEQQVPELWLRIGIAAAAALLCAVAVRAIADVIWGRDSKWGRRTRLAGSAIAAVGLASVLLVQGAAMFHLQEKISSIPRLKEIGSIQRIVQSFRR